MAAFENVELLASVDIAAPVTCQRQFVVIEIRARRLTIVACKEDQRILESLVSLNRFDDPTHFVIHLQNEVAIGRRLAFPDPFRGGNDGSMRSR